MLPTRSPFLHVVYSRRRSAATDSPRRGGRPAGS
jgi:hypothetical protein